MTDPIKPYMGPVPDCGFYEFVTLEMVGEVPEIKAGDRLTWSSAGKQRFIHRMMAELTFDEEGYPSFAEGYKVKAAAYHGTPDFDAYPRGVEFYPPSPGACCMLESVVSQGKEQLARTGFGLNVFMICITGGDPLAVAWPMFNQEQPLTLGLHNPLESDLPPFSFSLHLSVPKDFAEHWMES